MAQAVTLGLDERFKPAAEAVAKAFHVILFADVPDAIMHYSLDLCFILVQIQTSLNWVLLDESPHPPCNCLVRKHVRNVRWLTAGVLTCEGSEAMGLQGPQVARDDVTCGRLVKTWSTIGSDDAG